ncbi:MAG: PIN domain nuclease [Candidatus Methylomirabilia bacterium]
MARIVIDSSVWIEYYRPAGSPALREAVRGILSKDLAVTTGLIVVEVLQGAKTDADYALLKQDFSALPWLDLSVRAVMEAARLGFDLSRRGTPVPATDLLIAAVALAHDCELWHLDAHFDRISSLTSLSARRPGQ